MAFRIIRGALVGIVLGLLIGVGLSGSMYLFNYMKSGADWEKNQTLISEDEELYVDTAEGEYVPTLNANRELRKNLDVEEGSKILEEQGINALARELARDKWNLEEQAVAEAAAVGTSDEETAQGNGSSTDWMTVAEDNQEDVLGNSLIRFHVRANSNSEVDIALKYKVRDEVLFALEEGLTACTTKEEAEDFLTENLELIEDISEDALSEEGYNYAVDAYVTNDYFPMRQYGEMVLPAGYYQALRIDIGLANGENFWCLLYPTMCFPMEAGGVITKEGQQELEQALTPEQYEKLFVKKDVPEDEVEIRFKLIDMLFGED